MIIQTSTDVQNRRLTNGFMLTRVGVTDVKKPVRVVRQGRSNTLFCNIDVYVDLPSTQKGSHLSRNLKPSMKWWIRGCVQDYQELRCSPPSCADL